MAINLPKFASLQVPYKSLPCLLDFLNKTTIFLGVIFGIMELLGVLGIIIILFTGNFKLFVFYLLVIILGKKLLSMALLPSFLFSIPAPIISEKNLLYDFFR